MTTPQSFQPPIRTLMGPGPSDVHPRVLAACARPTVGHLDPSFVSLMDDVQALLRRAFKTNNALTMPVSAPGSAGMEMCLVNLVEPGDTVVVAINGVFGGRMKAIVERCGAKAVVVEDPWGAPVDPNKVEGALKANPGAKALAFVHAETSTGARSDAKTLAEIAHRHDALAIVDTVTSLGGIELDVDGWQLDAVYSGSQKCLSAPPGLSPVTFSDRAVEAVKARKTPVQSWFLDTTLVMGYWGSGAKRSYHHTAPVNAIYGLHESLVMLFEEGLEASWARHRRYHEQLAAGLEKLGLTYVVDAEYRLPQLNAVRFPEGVDDAATRRALLDRFGLEIGGGLGDLAGKVWRIGLMGTSACEKNVALALAAIEAVI
ncbi:MAG: alanine--glyoxylate aminotransferase family protein [Deltaproteobacteria bacterium]|jgi:alanine-glyoxylate transaminase/serine-glyoxylate transaminase/serine-pyruvate transaminase